MERLLEQIRAYELMNNLIPGAVLYALLRWHTSYYQIDTVFNNVLDNVLDNVFKEMVAYYFVGLVAGRFGSLIIATLLSKFAYFKMESYSAYITASQKDPKIETLSSVCNMYRSFASVFVLYAIWLFAAQLARGCPALDFWISVIGSLLLILLFIMSYGKQMQRVGARIKYSQNL